MFEGLLLKQIKKLEGESPTLIKQTMTKQSNTVLNTNTNSAFKFSGLRKDQIKTVSPEPFNFFISQE